MSKFVPLTHLSLDLKQLCSSYSNDFCINLKNRRVATNWCRLLSFLHNYVLTSKIKIFSRPRLNRFPHFILEAYTRTTNSKSVCIVSLPGIAETPPKTALSAIITNNNSIAAKSLPTLLSQDLRKTCSGHNRNCAVVELYLGSLYRQASSWRQLLGHTLWPLWEEFIARVKVRINGRRAANLQQMFNVCFGRILKRVKADFCSLNIIKKDKFCQSQTLSC